MTKREKELTEALKKEYSPELCWEAYCIAFDKRNPFLAEWRKKGEKEGWLEPIEPPKSTADETADYKE